jgi:hypothetical protein
MMALRQIADTPSEKEHEVAGLTCLKFERTETIAPDGQSYFSIQLDQFTGGRHGDGVAHGLHRIS